MPDTFELEIATPDRLILRERVSEAQIPGSNGYLGILPGHSPLLSALGTGELTYTADGRPRSLVVHGGYVEVLGDHVRVLANAAERAEEIDAQRAQEALRRAQERMNTIDATAGIDVARALNAAKRAEARLRASEHRQ